MKRVALCGVLIVSIAACACRSEGRVQRLYDTATAQLWRGELTEAAASVKQAEALSEPNSMWSWRLTLLRAEIHLVARELRDASVALAPSPPEAAGFEWHAAKHRYLQGQLAILQGKLEGASRLLDEASRLAARVPATEVALDVGAMQGQVRILQQNWDQADQILNDTVTNARRQSDRYHEAVALLNLGTAHLFRNRFDHALQYLERILAYKELDDRLVYSVALTNAGICYYRLGDIDRAIDAQTRAVTSHERPGRPRVFYERALGELGTTYLVKGDIGSATMHLRKAMDVAKAGGLSADASLWAANLANAHIQRGEWQQAEAVNAEATRLGGDRPDLHAGVAAEIALGQGRLDEASRLFRDALALAKGRPSMQWSMYEGLGRTAIAAKKPTDAERHFQATLDVIERTQSDLLKADYRLSFLTRLLGFYQRYVDLLVDERDPGRALAIADSSRGRVLAERQNINAPTRVTPVDLRRTAAQLDAVLLFYWIGDRSYAWQVTKDRIRFVPLAVNAAQVDAMVKSYQ